MPFAPKRTPRMPCVACALATGLSALPATTNAQEFDGASLGLQYTNVTADTGDQVTWLDLDARAAYGLGSGFGAQISFDVAHGLSHDALVYGEVAALGATLHGYYDATESLRLGLFVAATNTSGLSAFEYGLAAIFSSGPLRLEAYARLYHEAGGFDGQTYGLLLDYALGESLTALARLEQETFDGAGDLTRVELGLGYDLASGGQITVTYGQIIDDLGFGPGSVFRDQVWTLGYRHHFGAAGPDRLFRPQGQI